MLRQNTTMCQPTLLITSRCSPAPNPTARDSIPSRHPSSRGNGATLITRCVCWPSACSFPVHKPHPREQSTRGELAGLPWPGGEGAGEGEGRRLRPWTRCRVARPAGVYFSWRRWVRWRADRLEWPSVPAIGRRVCAGAPRAVVLLLGGIRRSPSADIGVVVTARAAG